MTYDLNDKLYFQPCSIQNEYLYANRDGIYDIYLQSNNENLSVITRKPAFNRVNKYFTTANMISYTCIPDPTFNPLYLYIAAAEISEIEAHFQVKRHHIARTISNDTGCCRLVRDNWTNTSTIVWSHTPTHTDINKSTPGLLFKNLFSLTIQRDAVLPRAPFLRT